MSVIADRFSVRILVGTEASTSPPVNSQTAGHILDAFVETIMVDGGLIISLCDLDNIESGSKITGFTSALEPLTITVVDALEGED